MYTVCTVCNALAYSYRNYTNGAGFPTPDIGCNDKEGVNLHRYYENRQRKKNR